MRLTVCYDDAIVPIELGASETVLTLKSILEADTRVPVAMQEILWNDRIIADSSVLSEVGLADDDMVVLRRRTSMTSHPSSRDAPLPGTAVESLSDRDMGALSWQDIPADIDPAVLYRVLRANERMLHDVRNDAEIQAAVRHPDPSKLRLLMMSREMERQASKLEQAALRERLARNPYDTDAQQRLEELIRKDNVLENRRLALEETPESFGRVVLLYMECEVNGVRMQAMVDSGAQTTIMSRRVAEACGLMRLCDTDYAGQVVGVGHANLIGRVHLTQIKVGKSFFPFSVSIVDQDGLDFLFGLDMLKRHRCVIDLARHHLELEGATGKEIVPFLGEGDIRRGALGSEPPASAAASSSSSSSSSASSSTSTSTPASAAGPRVAVPVSGSPTRATELTPMQTMMVEELTTMGIPRERAIAALEACQWDVEQARDLALAAAM